MEHEAATVTSVNPGELENARAADHEAVSTSSAADVRPKISEPASGLKPSARYRRVIGNICLALLFFTALIPTKPNYHSGLANDIWLVGAVLMGVLSLVRIPARSAMVSMRAILATGAVMTIPAMMRPGSSTTGAMAEFAIVLEVVGIAFSQISRIYLGRRFGLLPANRGIVSGGPFRLIRHPIYAGWLVLTMGFLMAYPTRWNIGMILASMPFLIWRINLEEEHLSEDPEYREYLTKTPYRLIPGIY